MKNIIILTVLTCVILFSCASGGSNKETSLGFVITDLRIKEAPVIPDRSAGIANTNLPVSNEERKLIEELFSGKSNDFDLSIRSNKIVYYAQENLFINLNSGIDCYFLVFYIDAGNVIQVLYPNPWEPDTNFLKARIQDVIPKKADFRLQPPYGEELLLVFATDYPVSINEAQFNAAVKSRDFFMDLYSAWMKGDGVQYRTDVPRCAVRKAAFTVQPR